MAELLKYCFENWPAITAYFIIAGVLIAVTYKTTTKYHHWTNKITTSEIDCSKIDGHIVPRLSTIDTNISNLGNSFDSLLVYLKSKDTGLDARLIKAFSPIQLTESGMGLLTDSGGKLYVEKYLSNILEDMEKQNFKSALDVQNYATIIPIRNFNLDEFIDIRNYIYQHPVYKIIDGSELSVNAQVISQVIGVYIRDKYFEKHPELKEK